MGKSPTCGDCGHSLGSHPQESPNSTIYKCQECECEVKGDPYLRKSSFYKMLCQMCLKEKPLIYNQDDKWDQFRGICQECYDRLRE